MLLSHSIKGQSIDLADINENLSMVPFDLETLKGIPQHLVEKVRQMTSHLLEPKGEAYLTVHTKELKANDTHRRPGAHIDGNYIIGRASWGGGGGWKVGGDGQTLTTKEHSLSYDIKRGGMLIASDYPACRGWNGVIKGKASTGGDCSHIDLKDHKWNMLERNTVYYGTSQFIHESLPVNEDVTRTLMRITLPADYPYLTKLHK
jgi:hypothetical protein